MVYAIAAFLVLPHLMEIVRQTEHWPFSNYPMWARVSHEWHQRQVVPMGVLADERDGEISLTDPAYFAPMPLYYQRLNFAKAAGRARVRDKVLGDYLAAYERRRSAGLHSGPRLGGIRLYEHYWMMDRHASNATEPERRTLLYEFPAKGTQPATAPAATGDAR